MCKKCWLAVVLMSLLAVLSALGILAFLPPRPGVTYANFSRIEKGMTHDEVVALLGEPREDARNAWKSPDGDHVCVEFRKGAVVRAAWNGSLDERTAFEKVRDRIPFLAHKPPRFDIILY